MGNEGWFKDVCSRLNVVSEEGKKEFLHSIGCAQHYYILIRDNPMDVSYLSEQNKLLKNYLSSIKKLQKTHSELLKDRIATNRFCEGFIEKAEKTTYKYSMLENLINHFRLNEDGDHNYIGDSFMEDILEFVHGAVELSIEEPFENKTKPRTRHEMLIDFLEVIGKNWPKESEVKFTVGNYYKEIREYKSEAVDICYDIISVFDSDVTKVEVSSAIKAIENKKRKSLQ